HTVPSGQWPGRTPLLSRIALCRGLAYHCARARVGSQVRASRRLARWRARPASPRNEERLMFVSTAYAQGFSLGDNQAMMQFLPLVLIFVVFYFLLIRPQQKRAKDHKIMLSALRRGDRVVTGGGIIGTVSR